MLRHAQHDRGAGMTMVDGVGYGMGDEGSAGFLGGLNDGGDFFGGDKRVGRVVHKNEVIEGGFDVAKKFKKSGLAGFSAGDDRGGVEICFSRREGLFEWWDGKLSHFRKMIFFDEATGESKFCGIYRQKDLVDLRMVLKNG